MPEALDTAVVLAAGRGSRLRAGDGSVRLDPAQAAAAEGGLKALVPFSGRPFLDRVVAALERCGVHRICLVVAPAHAPFEAWLREHEATSRGRARVELAIQEEPRGSGDALLAAESFVLRNAGEAGDRGNRGDRTFLAVNCDNLYPPAGLAALARGGRPGLLVVDRRRLLADPASNIDAAKIVAWSLVERDADGFLARILEKPDAATWASAPEPVLLGVNAWSLPASIFDHCRAIEPSERGEIELPAAVEQALAGGERFAVEVSGGPLLDLSSRADIPRIADLLALWQDRR